MMTSYADAYQTFMECVLPALELHGDALKEAAQSGDINAVQVLGSGRVLYQLS